MDELEYRIYDNHDLRFRGVLRTRMEFGRQRDGNETPYKPGADGANRLVIAPREEQPISRHHLSLEPLEEGRILVRNIVKSPGAALAVTLSDGRELGSGEECVATAPVVLSMGRKAIRIERIERVEADPEGELQSLPASPEAPEASTMRTMRFPQIRNLSDAPHRIVAWLQSAMGAFQSAATSADFFEKAARALVDVVGLESGRVLLAERGWSPAAEAVAEGRDAPLRPHSARVLDAVRRDKRTFWNRPGGSVGHSPSIRGVTSIVAAPILDRKGEVIGALYGDSRSDSATPLTELDAMLVELLATAVAAGLARLEQEKAAMESRVRFEQFFSEDLSRELLRRPDLLKGQKLDISVLFCDIRGFSTISERVGPATTMAWIGDVLDALSKVVLRHEGVLVDYIGDALMAMWGAPRPQDDHARQAAAAAVEMVKAVGAVDAEWRERLKAATEIGIGINTGEAQVGNTGSSVKFKYGPLGNEVNVASRVQGATRHFQCGILATGATCEGLDAAFPRRRVRRVRMKNITQPFDLFELPVGPDSAWDELRGGYEDALGRCESNDVLGGVQRLGALLARFPGDEPSKQLLARAASHLSSGTPFDPVLELTSK